MSDFFFFFFQNLGADLTGLVDKISTVTDGCGYHTHSYVWIWMIRNFTTGRVIARDQSAGIRMQKYDYIH